MERIKPHTCQLIAFLILLYILWGCAPLNTDHTAVTNHQPDTQNATSSPAALDERSTIGLAEIRLTENLVADELSVPEPEQTLIEEVRDLEALGDWEAGQSEQVAAAEEVQYDFPITMNRQVEYYLDFFQNKQPKTFARWMARSGRYVPMIKEKLKEAGLPQDLAYLPMIESGFSLTAYSRARAVGPWQFIQATGRNYGLTINNSIDERRDPVKSTDAAIAYLSNLYDEFGCWQLAVAGYNAGEGKIRRAIKKYKTNDFWKIAQGRYLKSETKLYVPKLIAAILIAKNPEQYGFTDIEYEPPLAYDVVEVPPWTSLKAVALACDTDFDEILNLNRQLRKRITPSNYDTYPIKVPKGKKTLVAENLPRVRAIVTTSYKNHVVKSGETVTRVCRRYNLNKTTLLKANNLRSANLKPGQRLRIPYQTTTYKLLAENSADGKAGPAAVSPQNLVLHTVQSGETISQLAKRYNVPPHMIASWNGLKDLHRIKAGQQLAFYLQDNFEQLDSRPVRTNEAKVVLSTTDKKRKPDSSVTYYQVRGGDTLWDIAKKFQVTPQKIKRWNKLKDNTIYPGHRLLLKLAAGDADV